MVAQVPSRIAFGQSPLLYNQRRSVCTLVIGRPMPGLGNALLMHLA
jgi:hypothetical protein